MHDTMLIVEKSNSTMQFAIDQSLIPNRLQELQVRCVHVRQETWRFWPFGGAAQSKQPPTTVLTTMQIGVFWRFIFSKYYNIMSHAKRR